MGAEHLGGGLRPPSETSPQEDCAGKAGARIARARHAHRTEVPRNGRWFRGVIAGAGLAFAAIAAVPGWAAAHPLGNFSISQYAGIRIERDAVVLRYIVDMAEIPTFQEIQETRLVPDVADPSVKPYLRRTAEMLRKALLLEVDGRRLSLEVESRDLIFPPGAGGLPTMKIGFLYRAKLEGRPSASTSQLRYRDQNFEGRAGWKEVIALGGSGVTVLTSSVPDRDRSRELADYPTDLLNSPPQDLEARVTFTREPAPLPLAKTTPPPPAKTAQPAPPPSPSRRSGMSSSVLTASPSPAEPKLEAERPPAPAAAPETSTAPPAEAIRLQPNTQSPPRSALTELVTTGQLSVGIVAMALAVAAALGAFHALEPGHGKTVVAAYLVGSRGTAGHAFLLGLIVTASHTAGVYLLGAVTFFASQYVLPERLYPWLGVASGLTIAGLGCVLFVRRYAGAVHPHPHGHDHGGSHRSHALPGEHSHAHATHPHHHDHDPGHEHGHDPGDGRHHHHGDHTHHPHHGPGPSVSLRELFALGVTGGIVPCPAALVVLLSALSLRRVGFGMLLIVAFSVGLAAVLIAIGILMVYARRLMSRFREDSPLVTRWLPLASSAVITVLGIAIAVQALLTAGIVQIRLG